MNLWRNSMTYGAYAGLISIAFFLVTHYAGNSSSPLQYLSYIPFAIVLFLGTRHFRDRVLGGYMSYGRALGSGVLISLFCGIILAFFMYLFMKFIDTDQIMIRKIVDQQEQSLIDRNMSEEEIEQAMEITRKFMTPGFVSVMAVFGYMFVGFIISLIISIFLKKEDKSFDGFIKNQGS